MEHNCTGIIEKLSLGCQLVGCKEVYNLKYNLLGINYNETFSLLVEITSIWVILALATQHDLHAFIGCQNRVLQWKFGWNHLHENIIRC